MMAKPMETLELHYPMIQFLIAPAGFWPSEEALIVPQRIKR